MYRRAKTQERCKHELKKAPSFSSSILEKIDRSIDEAEKQYCGGGGDLKVFMETTTARKQTRSNNRAMQEEDMTSTLARACLMDQKWMDKNKFGDKVVGADERRQYYSELLMDRKLDHHDVMFLRSTSSTCSDTTSHDQSMHYCYRSRTTEILKSRALKIYSKLVKHPISHGGDRLVNFLNSLFTTAKKYSKTETKSKSDDQASTCSSASSYPARSCLSNKNSSASTLGNNGVKRKVRFYPVSVIVDEDGRPCGHTCLYEQEQQQQQDSTLLMPVTTVPTAWKIGRRSPKRKIQEDVELQVSEKTRRVEETAREEFMRYILSSEPNEEQRIEAERFSV